MNSDSDTTALRVEALSRTVMGAKLLDGVSFAVRRGEVWAIVGPSGAGKSSLLRLLVRLDEPSAGTVYLDGVDYRELPPRELRRRVGLVAQHAALFPGTVAENVRFGPRHRGVELSTERVEKLLAGVGLSGFRHRNVANLSGGEAQRVGLARTLANEPEILLLDEPTSALDETSREDVEALIRSIIRENELTCLIVTHDVAQARRTADHALLLRQGRVAEKGPIEGVLGAHPAVR